MNAMRYYLGDGRVSVEFNEDGTVQLATTGEAVASPEKVRAALLWMVAAVDSDAAARAKEVAA